MLSPGPVTFKATLPSTPLPALATHGLLAVEGPDAGAFLQAQLMNDVRALAPGQWQWTGWLSPKGRVIALMALLRTAPERLLVVCLDLPVPDLQARLQRYVFRSKVRLSALPDWTCAAELDAVQPAQVPADRASGDDATGWRLDMGGQFARRALWLLPPDTAQAAPADEASSQAWFALDLAHGLPRLPPEGVEAWTPQMLSLERLHAFSLGKGCYPGQEIVARTHYLGKAKRGLVRLGGEFLQVGQSVLDADGNDVGQIACAQPDGRQALAVASLDRLGAPLRTGQHALEQLPLGEGLARPL
jgi:folate-binding protein YgfZ